MLFIRNVFSLFLTSVNSRIDTIPIRKKKHAQPSIRRRNKKDAYVTVHPLHGPDIPPQSIRKDR